MTNLQKLVKRISRSLIISGAFITAFFYMLILTPQPVAAAPCQAGDGAVPTNIFVPWYEYLECTDTGSPDIEATGGWEKAIPLIAMAIIALLTRVAGLIAVGFIIWGGIQYTISQGEPDGINNAKSTIMNAIVGLVISIVAVGIIQFVAGLIK